MSRTFYLPLLLIMISGVYFYTAANRAVLDDGDALYAHVAQEMVQRDDWVTPYANGVRFLDKPPMMYWLMGVSYLLFGVTEFAARLPSALAVLGTAMILFFIGKRTAGTSAGFAAGLSAAFSVGMFLFTRMVFPDMIFVFFLTLALSSFLRWHASERNPALPAMIFYGSLAGAILTKGLIGIVFPLVIIALFMCWMRGWARLKHSHPGKGVLLFLALALPWHMIAAHRNPGFLWYFFVNEQFLRFLGRRQPMDYESISVPLFWMLILVWLFPWSAFFPAVRHLIRSPGAGTAESRPIVWMSVSWVLVVLIFFSISSRIEHYSLPLLPPLALLVGMAISPNNHHTLPVHDGWQRSVSRGFAVLGVAGALVAATALAGALTWIAGWGANQALGEAAHRLHAYRHFFAPLFDLPPQILEQLRIPLAWTALVLSAGLLGAWVLDRGGHRMRAIITLSVTMMAFSFFACQSLGICEEVLSSRQFGRALNRLYRSGDEAIVVGDYETANSLNFYAPVKLHVYGGTAAVLEWGLRYPDAQVQILSRAGLESRWNSARRAFLLCADDEVPGLPLDKAYVVLESSGRTLFCNQPVF